MIAEQYAQKAIEITRDPTDNHHKKKLRKLFLDCMVESSKATLDDARERQREIDAGDDW